MVENLGEIFRYRELIRNLTLRDLKVRYRNSVLGLFWAWGNPILMTLVFTIVFTVLQKSTVQRYPLFILIGWLVWAFTTSAIGDGVGSVVSNANLVKKVYFPREVLPASAVLANAANFLLTLPLLLGLIVFYRVPVGLPLVEFFPIILVAQVAFVMGLSFLLAALNVFYRDTAVIIGVLLTAWFFLTPVFYPVQFLTGVWHGIDLSRLMYYMNPMASIIEAYRSIFYGSIEGGPPAPPNLEFLARTFVTSLAVLAIGYLAFNRVSHRFGEEL
jgi:homopolymeric O-antigen transport system permease protein